MSLLEHRRNEEILEEARVEPIAMVMRRMDWFGHVKRRYETENIIEVMEMEGKRPRGRPDKFAMERHCQKGPENLEYQGGIATDRERCIIKVNAYTNNRFVDFISATLQDNGKIACTPVIP